MIDKYIEINKGINISSDDDSDPHSYSLTIQ